MTALVSCFARAYHYKNSERPAFADSIAEIKTICECGSKATVNARLDANMNIVTEGSQVMIGGNESYIAMCHKCWRERIKKQKNN
jgi:thymidine kinase